MKPNQIKLKAVAISVVLGVLILITLNAGGGNLEPNAPPNPTMHTLEDIYKVVSSGTEPPAQPFAVDMFLKIEGISGESQDVRHQDWIEILSYSHGVSQPSAAIGPVEHKDLSITKYVDKSSPILAVYACAGGVPAGAALITYAELEVCSAEDSNDCFMKYRISDVNVTSVNAVGYVRVSGRPIEEVTFNYSKIEWTYIMSDGNSIQIGWDIDADAPIDPYGVLPID